MGDVKTSSKTTTKNIVITKTDFERLSEMVEQRKEANSADRHYIETLEQELDRAEIVEASTIPNDVVTMNSQVHLKDLDSGQHKTYRLIFPRLNPPEDSISILAPIGTALLGYRAGDVVEWVVPKGIRKFQILEVIYQPEAAGNEQSSIATPLETPSALAVKMR